DFSKLAVCCYESDTCHIKLLDVNSGRQLAQLELPEKKFSSSFDRLAFGVDDRTLTAISGSLRPINRLVYWSLDRVICWDLQNAKVLTSFEPQRKRLQNSEWSYYPLSVGNPPNFLPRFVLRCQLPNVDIVELATGKSFFGLPHCDHVWCGLTPDVRHF